MLKSEQINQTVHYHSFTGLFAIHKSLRDSIGSQDLISVNDTKTKQALDVTS